MNIRHIVLVLIVAILLAAFGANAQETCNASCQIEQQDVNTPVPKSLEDAEIIIRTKDGKEQKMSANEFKVVKRKQQFKVREKIVERPVYITTEIVRTKEVSTKNTVFLEARHDFTRLSTDVTTNGSSVSAKVNSEKNMIFGINYMRRELFDTRFGLGLGLDTNATVKGYLGYDF